MCDSEHLFKINISLNSLVFFLVLSYTELLLQMSLSFLIFSYSWGMACDDVP